MNYIPQIAKMLGVEMGERFKIKDTKRKIDTPFYFAEDGLRNKESPRDVYSMTLMNILCGKYKVTKLPWKPQDNEEYYFPYVVQGEADYTCAIWDTQITDLARYDAGLVCRTKEEAIEKAKKMLAAVKDEH